MSGRYPEIVYTEESIQHEDANTRIDTKVALLDVLSETGLKRIVVGSCVSPPYTLQMASEAGMRANARFGSNFLGDFPVDAVMKFLEEVHGDWPWTEPFFPKPSSITGQDGQ
jgi:hypothetical protein